MRHLGKIPLSILALSAFVTVSFARADGDQPPIQPTFEEHAAMQLGGIATYGTPANGLFAKLWQRFHGDVENQPGVSTLPYVYGVSMDVPGHKTHPEFSYLAAGEITDTAAAPLYLLRLPLPAGTYAVFKLNAGTPEGLAEIGPLLGRIYLEWLPSSGYVSVAPINIERYDTKANTIAILIPVKKK